MISKKLLSHPLLRRSFYLSFRVRPSYWCFIVLLNLVTVQSFAQPITIDGDPAKWPGILSDASYIKVYLLDPMNSSSDDKFTGGSKQNDLLSGWRSTNNNVNDKEDLGNVGAAYKNGYLYFFADRYASNGNAGIGIWIFKDGSVSPGYPFSGEHQDGDILVTSLFSNGGGTENPRIFKWQSGGLVEITTSGIAGSFTNNVQRDVPAGFTYVGKDDPKDKYIPGTFFEAWVDLGAAGLSIDVCATKFVINTAEADGEEKNLADLVFGSFPSKPAPHTLSGSTFCEGNANAGTLSLDGSEIGVNYQLYNNSDNTAVGLSVAGTGSGLNWTGLAAGSYYVVGTSNTSPCSTTYGPATVVINPLPVVSATATPATIIITAANHSSQLNADLTGSADTNPANYTFSWTQDLPASAGSLDNSNIQNPVFTPTLSGASQTFTFEVTVINTITGCFRKATVQVSVSSFGGCSVNGPTADVCAGSTNSYSSTVQANELSRVWTVSGDAAISGANNGASVNVVAGITNYTVSLTIVFQNTAITATCSKNVTVSICNFNNCSYTQGYYGNKNGSSCDGSTTYKGPVNIIATLLPLTVGAGSNTVLVSNATALNSVMPGGSTPRALVNGAFTVSTTNPFKASYLTSTGKINNVLLSQTITLALNTRLNGGSLAGLPIQSGYLSTIKLSSCGSGATALTCSQGGTIKNFVINSNVVNYLTNFGANPATVADLLALANAVLGGTLTPGIGGIPSFSDVNNAVDAINNAFDGCAAYLGYHPQPLSCPAVTPAFVSASTTSEMIEGDFQRFSVKAYPNPFTDKVQFVINSPVSGKAQLEVANMLGQKVAIVYNGYIEANKSQVVEYSVPSSASQNLIYILKVGNEKITGKLFRIQK